MTYIKNKNLVQSFGNAVAGVVYVLRNERNMKIHSVTAVVVVLLCLILGLDGTETALLYLCLAFVLVSEMFNSSIEIISNVLKPEFDVKVKLVKDAASGAVLVAALFALVSGIVVLSRHTPGLSDISRTVITAVTGVLFMASAAAVFVAAITGRHVKASGREEDKTVGIMTGCENIEFPLLIEAALAAKKQAYSPYSGFNVGAAVLGGSGKVYSGANIENASFSATCCAERTAVYSAVLGGEKAIKAAAVISDSRGIVYPCGVCRQVLAEFAGNDMPVLCSGADGFHEIHTLGELLPHAFRNYGKDEAGEV